MEVGASLVLMTETQKTMIAVSLMNAGMSRELVTANKCSLEL